MGVQRQVAQTPVRRQLAPLARLLRRYRINVSTRKPPDESAETPRASLKESRRGSEDVGTCGFLHRAARRSCLCARPLACSFDPNSISPSLPTPCTAPRQPDCRTRPRIARPHRSRRQAQAGPTARSRAVETTTRPCSPSLTRSPLCAHSTPSQKPSRALTSVLLSTEMILTELSWLGAQVVHVEIDKGRVYHRRRVLDHLPPRAQRPGRVPLRRSARDIPGRSDGREGDAAQR